MKKILSNVSFSILFLFIFVLTACSSKQDIIEGKYVSIYDESTYLSFNKDGSVTTNLWTTHKNGEDIPLDCLVYSVDENNIITAIDTTEYEGQNEPETYEIGLKYKNYICASWEGTLPKTYANFTLTKEINVGDIYISKYSFNEDKTYEYTVTFNNEVVHSESGTYTISKEEVVCTSVSGETYTFINIDNNAYFIEYVKE